MAQRDVSQPRFDRPMLRPIAEHERAPRQPVGLRPVRAGEELTLMAAVHKPTQATPAQKPEERFKELVAIREQETQVRAEIEAARAQAQRRLAAVDEEITAKRTQAIAQAQAEMKQVRARGLTEADAQAARLLEQAEAEAKTVEAQVRERQGALLEQLKDELLALK